MKKTVFIKNAFILTACSLFLRFLGIIFKVWLANKIGSEGIGLYQLVFSVYVLASTFASSGISTAVTRLVAEELALGSKNGVIKILKRAIELTLIIAFLSLGIIYFGANPISKHLLCDLRAVSALKILAFSLPFMGVSSCIRGYFIAQRRVAPNVLTQLLEQAVRIGLIVTLIGSFAGKGLSACCFAVLLGDMAAEAVSCLCLIAVFLRDKRKLLSLSGRKNPPYGVAKRILHICLPITGGRYLNSLLRTAENLLVPKNLAKYSKGGQNALSQFGMIKGMALPILFFPSAILNSVGMLLIPEISEAVAKNNHLLVSNTCKKILKLTSLLGFVFGAVFFVAGEEIGYLIYKDVSVGRLLKYLSPIVPLMYLDSISDGILKGLDQQGFTFRTAITDSLLRIILILAFLPKTGLTGFIIIMYISNLLTCLLNVGRLLRVSKIKITLAFDILLPLFCAVFVTLLADILIRQLPSIGTLVYIILLCLLTLPVYLFLLVFCGVVSQNEIKTAIKRV